MRVHWLTCAVRALLKADFREKYSTSSVGQADDAIRAEEAKLEGANALFQQFLREPDEAKARQMMEDMTKEKK